MSRVHSAASQLHTQPGAEQAALDLIERLESGERGNSLDVLIEVALFKPCATFDSIRTNAAGTKVIYTYPDGQGRTFWAADWSLRPSEAIEALRRRLPTTASSVGMTTAKPEECTQSQQTPEGREQGA